MLGSKAVKNATKYTKTSRFCRAVFALCTLEFCVKFWRKMPLPWFLTAHVGELREEEMAGEVCSASCDLCKGNLHSKHVHTAGWCTEHADRCVFLKQMGISLSSTTCICLACNTGILRGTRLLMDDKLPQRYKPRWCKRVRELVAGVVTLQEHSSTLSLCMAHYL